MKSSPISGESGTVSFYLSLLSTFYQKPISRSVTATAFLEFGDYSRSNNCPYCLQEQIIKNPFQYFSKVRISPVGGLEYKVPAAVEAGVKKLILSSEQQVNYEQVVPFEIREKLKVYYVKNVEELEELFWKGEFS